MSREEIYEKLNEVFRDVFDDESITVNDETVASDVEGWDSLAHINLMATVQEEFEIKIPMKDIVELKNVGDLVNIIESQVG